MSVVAKRLDGSRWHLACRWALAQATLCYMGTQLPPKRGYSAQFSAHVPCSPTAGWLKMPLGVELGLGPGDFVLDGDPAPSQKRGTVAALPLFGRCLLWPEVPISATAELLLPLESFQSHCFLLAPFSCCRYRCANHLI